MGTRTLGVHPSLSLDLVSENTIQNLSTNNLTIFLHVLAQFGPNDFNNFGPKTKQLLFMAEILNQLISSLSHYL